MYYVGLDIHTKRISPGRSHGGGAGTAGKQCAVHAKGPIDVHNARTVVDLELLRRARAQRVDTDEDINGHE